MPFIEDFNEFLSIEEGFACDARITKGDGMSYGLRGILTKEIHNIDMGSNSILGGNIIFETADSELIDAEYDDLLMANNVNYKIKAIKADGTGWTLLMLEKQN